MTNRKLNTFNMAHRANAIMAFILVLALFGACKKEAEEEDLTVFSTEKIKEAYELMAPMGTDIRIVICAGLYSKGPMDTITQTDKWIFTVIDYVEDSLPRKQWLVTYQNKWTIEPDQHPIYKIDMSLNLTQIKTDVYYAWLKSRQKGFTGKVDAWELFKPLKDDALTAPIYTFTYESGSFVEIETN